MSTCAHSFGLSPEVIPYKKTQVNHPCAVWVRESSGNYDWLFKLLFYLHKEYTFRYDKIHASAKHLPAFLRIQSELREIQPRLGLTPFRQAMPSFCNAVDPVHGYRNLYVNVKSRMRRAGWRRCRRVPRWYSSYAGSSVNYQGLYLSSDSLILEDLGISKVPKPYLRRCRLMDSLGRFSEE